MSPHTPIPVCNENNDKIRLTNYFLENFFIRGRSFIRYGRAYKALRENM